MWKTTKLWRIWNTRCFDGANSNTKCIFDFLVCDVKLTLKVSEPDYIARCHVLPQYFTLKGCVNYEDIVSSVTSYEITTAHAIEYQIIASGA